MADIAFGIAGGAQNIRLAVGETAILRVEENPGTGYVWLPAGGDAAAASGLSLERLDFQQQSGAGVGAGGQRAFRLRARQGGTHRLVLELRRSWESGPARARIEVTVEVR
jgi:predicted secreted protein